MTDGIVCGDFLPDFDWPDAGEGGCCEGAAYRGPRHCTCWEPVYSYDQADPRTELPADVMPAMCADCAYRPGSPERNNDESVVCNAELLNALVENGGSFWCHNGLRKVVAYVHPTTGIRFMPNDRLDQAYQPPIIGGRPYKADGTPADLCAGWAARRLKHLQRSTP